MPLAVTTHYNFLIENSKFVPFAGLNLGGYRTVATLDHGWWYSTDDSWHFGISPEIGVRMRDVSFPIYLGIKFNYLVKTKDTDNQLFLGFNIGVAWGV
jgi:hypothetical protein